MGPEKWCVMKPYLLMKGFVLLKSEEPGIKALTYILITLFLIK